MAQKKEYVASREVERAREAVRAHEQARPGEYRSEYDQALKEAMDRILNQKDFQYRLNGDALYRQYRSQAVRDARRAMSDTMGQAAALAGGYGSSYAQAVGQQAYARQLEGLADRIPELYSLAMEQYKLRTRACGTNMTCWPGPRGRNTPATGIPWPPGRRRPTGCKSSTPTGGTATTARTGTTWPTGNGSRNSTKTSAATISSGRRTIPPLPPPPPR